MNVQSVSGPGVGPFFSPVTCVAYNRTTAAVAIGDVLMLDHLCTNTTYGSVALAPNTDVGNATAATKCWPLGNAILATTAGIGADVGDPGAIFGVVTSLLSGAGADNTKVELTLAGVVRAKTSGSVTFGDDMYIANGAKVLTSTYAAATRVLAKALHTGSAANDWVLFNGLGSPGGQAGDYTP